MRLCYNGLTILCMCFFLHRCFSHCTTHHDTSRELTSSFLNSNLVVLKCRQGVPFWTNYGNFTHPVTDEITARCLDSGSWNNPRNISCWKGLTVDVGNKMQKTISLPTEKPVVLSCGNPNPSLYNSVILYVGHHKIERAKVAWTNLTFSWKIDGIHVRCAFLSPTGVKTVQPWKQISLQYEPGFNRRVQTFNSKIGHPKFIFIHVYSKYQNLTKANIKIIKDGREVVGFLLDGLRSHQQVITKHFPKVMPDDLGDYIVIINDPGHPQTTELVHLRGDASEYNKNVAIAASVSVACILFVIIVIVAVACCFRRRKRRKLASEGDGDDVFLPSRSVRHMLFVNDDEHDEVPPSGSGVTNEENQPGTSNSTAGRAVVA